MKRCRFKETKDFAKSISNSWHDYVNHQGFKPLNLVSAQMTDNNIAISVRLAPGFTDRMSFSLYDSKGKWELFSMSPADNTETSLRYTIDFLLGYCKDIIHIPLQENS